MRVILGKQTRPSQRKGERGAAMVTVLLMSVPILMAGGTLILVTSFAATNTSDSAAEVRAYYAAEAGSQQVLGVLRGNVAPNPLFATNPVGSIASQNMIDFRKAVDVSTSNLSADTSSAARLSRWLSYDSTYTDRVTLTSNYSPVSGLAFRTQVTDPDNSKFVTFSTSGVFTAWGGNQSSHQFGGNPRFTLTYVPQASTTITNSGNSTLGTFQITDVLGTSTLSNESFQLTITQTSPWPATITINVTLSGTVSSSSSLITVTFPTTSNNLNGAVYTRSAAAVTSNSATPIAVAITAPLPNRLTATVTGFGPRAAQKQMQMLLSRYAFDFAPVATVTLRSAADNTSLANVDVGSSSVYGYSGYDNAGGPNLPALGVTSDADYNNLNSLSLPSGQVVGSPVAYQKIAMSNLPTWLQNTNDARALVIALRTMAQNNNRYFTPVTPPSDYGSATQPKITFLDGDCSLPPQDGAGLLVVTGALTTQGNASFDGLILVLGEGVFNRNGAGNGTTLGSIIVARFNNSGDFLAPTFTSQGSGNSNTQYDSSWIRRAMSLPGPRVMAVGEF